MDRIVYAACGLVVTRIQPRYTVSMYVVNSHNGGNTIIIGIINVYNVLDGARTWWRGSCRSGFGWYNRYVKEVQ